MLQLLDLSMKICIRNKLKTRSKRKYHKLDRILNIYVFIQDRAMHNKIEYNKQ